MRWAKRRVVACGILVVLAGCVFAPGALGRGGKLDSSFGDGGRVSTPVGFQAPWTKVKVQLAEAPNGALVVGGETTLVRYLPDGQLDPSFGEDGVVKVRLPGLRFELGDLGVDQENRVVAIGTAKGHHSSFATVVRYQRDGTLDASFGSGDGVVMTQLGLPPAPGRSASAVTATLGAVDDQNRITLIAGTVEPVAKCGGRPQLARRDRLIARLSPTGTLDRTFGKGGIASIDPLETVVSMAFDHSGGAVLAGAPRDDCGNGPHAALIRLYADGSRNRGFGSGSKDASRRLAGAVSAIALDSRGRIDVLDRPRQLKLNRGSSEYLRLLPDGRLDPSFGTWVFDLQGPLWRLGALAVEPQGRLLFVGTLIHPLSPRNGPPYHRWFMVLPVLRSGQQASGFGWLGWGAITRFDPWSDLVASETLIDQEGRLVIAGPCLRPRLSPKSGFAVARFRLNPLG